MKIFISSLLGFVLVLSSHATPVVHAGVAGNNDIDAYVGTGGLLLPASFTGGIVQMAVVVCALMQSPPAHKVRCVIASGLGAHRPRWL